MADLSTIESITISLDDSTNGCSVPSRFRYMEEFWIQIRIAQRIPEVGRIDLRSPIPRIWTGYYYLLSENCVVKSGVIEYENMEIYRAQNLTWKSESEARENVLNFSTPEIPIDIDGVDEAIELFLWLNRDDDAKYFMPRQFPIDFVQLYIPNGCAIDVMFCGIKFSPIDLFGNGEDVDIYEDINEDGEPDSFKPTPLNEQAFSPINSGNLISDFDAIARSRGYILESECGGSSGFDSIARSRGYITQSDCDLLSTTTIRMTFTWTYYSGVYPNNVLNATKPVRDISFVGIVYGGFSEFPNTFYSGGLGAGYPRYGYFKFVSGAGEFYYARVAQSAALNQGFISSESVSYL